MWIVSITQVLRVDLRLTILSDIQRMTLITVRNMPAIFIKLYNNLFSTTRQTYSLAFDHIMCHMQNDTSLMSYFDLVS